MRISGQSALCSVLHFHDSMKYRNKQEHKDYGVHKHPLHGAQIAGKEGFELDRLQRRAPRLMRLRMKLINTNKMLLIACNELVGFVATSIHLCQLQFVQTSQGWQGKHICPRYSRPRENTLGITSSYLPSSFLL